MEGNRVTGDREAGTVLKKKKKEVISTISNKSTRHDVAKEIRWRLSFLGQRQKRRGFTSSFQRLNAQGF